MPSSHISMRTVAEHAGVSPMTVSYVLRGRTDLFRPETAARVQQAIAELGYVPSRSPRAMRTGRHGAIAFVASLAVSSDVSWYAKDMLDAMLAATSARDLDLIYTRLVGVDDQPKLLRDANVDGLIVNSIARIEPELLSRLSRRYPLVHANQSGSEDAVRPDEAGAGALAAAHLQKAGCRRLGYVQFWADHGHFSFAARRDGFLASVGHEVAVMPLPNSPDAGEQLSNTIDFVAAEQPDGIGCLGQREAAAIIEALRMHGLRSEVVVFGERPCVVGVRPVPTVLMPYAEVGRQAVAMLLDKIEQPGPRPAVIVPVTRISEA